jgi:thiol:disulfide interchange protein DsbD
MLKILSLLFISFNLFAEILPAEKAFVSSAKVENGNLVVDFKIEDEYYLYKDKISIKALDGAKFGESNFSKSKTKNDDFFGEIQVYHHNSKITTPINSADDVINFEVKSQGCWEGGVCYPPTMQKLSVKNTANQNNQLSNKSNFFKALTQQSGINDPASVDIAFKFDAFKVDENTIKATWKIRDGYYMYHDKFNFSVDGADFGKIIFPEGEPKKDDFFGDIFVHKKQLVIDLPLKNVSDKIDLTVNYQGCWEGGVCYPPVEKKTTIQMADKSPQKVQDTEKAIITSAIKPVEKVIIEQIVGEVKKQPRDLTAEIKKIQQNQDLSEEEKVAKDFDNSSFFWILVSFFGFGILAAFTSCILPMIPILSSLIIGTDNPTKKKAFFMSLTFVIFMALTYAVVGVLAGMFGGNLQATFQNPWVIGSFSLMFVALAFSMFGYYEIKIPNWLQAKLTTISNKQKGGHLVGVAIMGVLSALIVGPCAAPVVSGALLYIGDSGDAVLGGSALFMMGLGMGLPLIVAGVGVATPRAGVWMDNVKAIFGVVMIGMAIYFLERIVDENITIILWAILLTISPIALGVVSSFDGNKPMHKIFKAIGLIVLGFGIMIWIAIARGYENIDMFHPLKSHQSAVIGTANVQNAHAEFKQVATLADLQNEINNSTKPVMLDFYADWCTYCIVYEKQVFTDNRVAGLMQEFTLLQVDITANNDLDQEILSHFKITAPPAILFFKGGNELRAKRVIGEKDADEFYEILQNI